MIVTSDTLAPVPESVMPELVMPEVLARGLVMFVFVYLSHGDEVRRVTIQEGGVDS
jgi:hypothetical protein